MAGWNPRDRRWIGFLPVAVFLVSSAALFGWWQDLVRAQERWLEQRLHAEATSLAIKVSERFDAYDAILRGGAAIFAASTVVTRDEFHTYVDALRLARNYPGIQGLGFSAWVPPERLEAFERAVRAEGFPDFAVRPPGPRDDYSAVLYLEPFTERNRLAFGLDGLAEPLRRAAMERARARNEASTTAMLRLAQENGDDVQPGVITFFPVRRPLSPPGVGGTRDAPFEGWVYMPLRMRDVMIRMLSPHRQDVRVEILDQDGPDADRRLFDSDPAWVEPARLQAEAPIQVNQRTWTIRLTAGAAYVAANRQFSPGVEFAMAAALVFLLTGLSAAAVAIWRSRERAVDLARSLRESESRWRQTFERAPVGIFTVDAQDRFLRVNHRYCEITGYVEDELLRMHRSDIVHPDDRASDAAVVRRVRNREVEVGSLERRGLRKDRTTFWAEATFSLEPAEPGFPAGMIGVLDDVTSRHEAEGKFREIAERSLAGILIMQDGRCVYANPIVAEMVSAKASEVEGRDADWLREHIHPEDLPAIRAAAIEAGAEVGGTRRPVVYRVTTSAGTRTVQQTARQIQHLGRPAMLVTLIDITERVKIEEELRKGQRLESLGIVAGGIAHDFNNLLTAVFGQVELAKGQVDEGSPTARELDVAISALARARDLTRQLLTFAAGGAPARKILVVPRLLEDAARLGLGGSSLRARFEFDPGLPPIEADEGQMSQLWNNLLVNARQASSGAGEILIRARSRTIRAGEVPGLAAGVHVEVAVQDRGHGIPPESLPHVFDPFFTTRATGTGLGLATSHSIVRRHGGHIGIASRVGEGTTVTVLLPASAGTPDAEAPVPGGVSLPGRLRVLIMDDEPMVLRVGARNFARLGLDVETASDGAEAVEKFRKNREEGRPFALVVLDLTVSGGMGGAPALQRMQEIDPGVVAIACSGYFDAAVMSSPGQFGFAGVLAKPYLAADLERVLADVLGTATRGTPGV